MSVHEDARRLLANVELDQVLGRPGGERAAYLISLHRRDEQLAADVEALLEERDALDAAGLLLSSDLDVTATSAVDAAGDGVARGWSGSMVMPGDRLGPYILIRLLGQGGMGAVYEATELETGRRVALKVLKQRLQDPHERDRFTREGRLAASLNHPHCVFVFAASELDGRLTIAMELMECTLADRLRRDGPLPAAEAVDAVLQLLSGLQAAAAIGIMHRDVKPSNCFVDADGVVKIGDFGISRSLRAVDETTWAASRVAATPSYASPEQLRGGTLDIRADIYSVGATLYELLTGRPPFERDDLMGLLMAVANDVPAPPHVLATAVPHGLSRVVLRCLAKLPEQRFADYAALAAGLEPYASTTRIPAALGRRFLAGLVDQCFVLQAALMLMFWWMGPVALREGASSHQLALWSATLLTYLALAEGIWAATPGQALVGLTLVDSQGRRPQRSRTFARAGIFAAVWTLGVALCVVLGDYIPSSYGELILSLVCPWLLPAILFSTARRRNGYAGWHDLVTGTRLVERTVSTARRVALPRLPLAAPPGNLTQVGPFRITGGAIPSLPSGWQPGFDERLRRNVWIRQLPAGAPPLDAVRLAVTRPTRLRWLAGRREAQEAWDAFEAVPGVPLEQACARPRPWMEVRWWLLDLARECVSHTPGDRPPLSAEWVWILDSGGAKLVDDPVADHAERDGSEPTASCATLLLDVVRSARGSSHQPWPSGAQRFLDRLGADPPPRPVVIVNELESLTRQRAMLTRGWRAAHILGLAAVPLLTVGLGAVQLMSRASARQQLPPDVRLVAYLLDEHSDAEEGIGDLSSQDLEAIEVVLASGYRHVLTSPRLSTMAFEFNRPYRSGRGRLEHILRRHPTDAEAQRASAHPFVQASLEEQTYARSGWRAVRVFGESALVRTRPELVFIAFFSLVTAVMFRGGLMRAMGLELVTGDGRPASRLRVLGRTVIAWSPLLVTIVVSRMHLDLSGFAEAAPAVPALLLGAIVSVVYPARGIQDRLAGTWIVPR
jgi:eukaryotic-like serine/threonine-protein kinase